MQYRCVTIGGTVPSPGQVPCRQSNKENKVPYWKLNYFAYIRINIYLNEGGLQIGFIKYFRLFSRRVFKQVPRNAQPFDLA